MTHRPANLCGLAGRYDNPMLESTISPSHGIRIYLWFEKLNLKILGHGPLNAPQSTVRVTISSFDSFFNIFHSSDAGYLFMYCMPKYCLYACVSLCPSPSCTWKMDGFPDAEIRRKARKMTRAEVWRPRLLRFLQSSQGFRILYNVYITTSFKPLLFKGGGGSKIC
jgi:hypothetical protein